MTKATKLERQTLERFSERYGTAWTDASRRAEQAVIGGDWGANGYTTAAQADVLAEALALAPTTRLLDLGAGRGWPGLYLAQRTGCEVVCTDVPVEGLRAAVARARVEGLSARSAAVVASARQLPFRAVGFDAIVHTDVLC